MSPVFLRQIRHYITVKKARKSSFSLQTNMKALEMKIKICIVED